MSMMSRDELTAAMCKCKSAFQMHDIDRAIEIADAVCEASAAAAEQRKQPWIAEQLAALPILILNACPGVPGLIDSIVMPRSRL